MSFKFLSKIKKKNEEYDGGYVPPTLRWDGKDSDGNAASAGTYRIVVEPQDKYRKFIVAYPIRFTV